MISLANCSNLAAMRHHGSLQNDQEANAAASEALKGAAIGAGRWAFPFTMLSFAGQVMSPVYRGLTIQFKVFLVMSGMVLGGMLEGDRRLREYEDVLRARKRIERDQKVWREWEMLVEEDAQKVNQKGHSKDRD